MPDSIDSEVFLKLNDKEVEKKLDEMSGAFLKWMGTADLTFSKQEQNTVKYGFKLRELQREYDKVSKALDGYKKLAEDAAKIGDTHGQMINLGAAQEMFYTKEALLDKIRSTAYDLSKEEHTKEEGGILSNVFGGDGQQLLKTLTGSVSDIAGISPDLTNTGLNLVSGLVTGAGAVTAATAVIKIITDLLKSKYERDKLEARIDSLAGTEAAKTGRQWAQAMGFKDDSRFGGIYADMLETNNGDVAKTIEMLNMAAIAGLGDETRTLDAAKNYQQILTSGSGSLQSLYGNADYMTNKIMSAPFSAYAKTGNTDAMNAVFMSYAQSRGYTEAFNKIENLDMTKFIKGVTRFTNSLSDSVMNGGESSYGSSNTFTYSGGSLKAAPVQVVNSIMLSDRTLDQLTELETKQWVANINVGHTTPMVSVTVNANALANGYTPDQLADMAAKKVGEKIMESQNNGSSISEVGGYY